MTDQPWLHNWEDYYQILGVDPEANAEGIRKAHTDKVWILHPDRMTGAPESARRQAEEELKKVNNAYDVLKDPQKRREYHEEWLKRGGKSAASGARYGVPKPKPVVVPDVIRFKDVKPGESQTGSFVIRNDGGPYSEIWFDDPGGQGSWVRVVDYRSLTSSELPIEIQIEAEGKEWGKSYVEYIRVKLDEEETQVRVELQTKPEPAREEAAAGGLPKAGPSVPPQVSSHRGFPTWGKWFIGLLLLSMVIVLIVQLWPSGTSPKTAAPSAEITSPVEALAPRKNLPSFVQDGDWFPDGSAIVFSQKTEVIYQIFLPGHKKMRYRIFVVNPDGTNTRELGLEKASREVIDAIETEDHVSPLVSPNGQRIAFVVDRDDHPASIYVMNVDGSNIHRITPHYGSIAYAWLSDETIVFWGSYYSLTFEGSSYYIYPSLSDLDLLSKYGKFYSVNINSGDTQELTSPPSELFRGKLVCM